MSSTAKSHLPLLWPWGLAVGVALAVSVWWAWGLFKPPHEDADHPRLPFATGTQSLPTPGTTPAKEQPIATVDRPQGKAGNNKR